MSLSNIGVTVLVCFFVLPFGITLSVWLWLVAIGSIKLFLGYEIKQTPSEEEASRA